MVGLTNLFAHDGDGWEGCRDTIVARFPDITIVGYETDDTLPFAQAAGFEPVAPLRIWIKSGLSGVDSVVVLGAPGSGKTTLARALARSYGWRFREWEQELVEEVGQPREFLAHKAEALADLHEHVRGLIASEGPPVVYETTGISDAAFLDEILPRVPRAHGAARRQ